MDLVQLPKVSGLSAAAEKYGGIGPESKSGSEAKV